MIEIEDILAQWAQARPDLDTAPMGLIGRLGRLAAHLSHDMGATFAQHGLSAASFDVLATLLRAGPPHQLSPNQLLATMMVTSGTMTNRIDQLAKDGLVARAQNPDDKRSVLICLTDKGARIIDAAVSDHVQTQSRLVAVLTSAERADLEALLQTYLSRLKAAQAPASGA